MSLKQSCDTLINIICLAVFLCRALRVEWPPKLPNFTLNAKHKI